VPSNISPPGQLTLPSGSVPLRREIRDLQQNYPQQWDRFCLSLLALQNVNESDQLSYYQIAGERVFFLFLLTKSEAYTALQACIASLIRLGTVLPVPRGTPEADTVLTVPFYSCHGTVHTSVSSRYDLSTVHNNQEL
jgi:hypothetical protein